MPSFRPAAPERPPEPAGLPAGAAGGRCRLCGAGLEHSLVDLGMQPLCQSVIAADRLDAMEPFYPLHALVCGQCFLVQLGQYVSAESIFGEYAYYSSYSTSWVEHARAYCAMITRRLGLGPQSLVVELASNDGYLLQHFRPLGIPVLGVEPAGNVARAAIARGIPTRIAFFGHRLAGSLVDEIGRADLVIGNNVLAQVPDLDDFVAGMARLVAPGGMITLEFPHLARLIEDCQFDTIYHEHFSYFSLLTVERLARRHGLALVDVEELATHGGSLRVYLAPAATAAPASAGVAEVIAREEARGLHDPAGYAQFAGRVHRIKRRLLSFLIGAREAGKVVCGYGAPGKGNTLLNYCGIGTDFLAFTVDRNPYKQGRFTPGMHIPIRPVEAIDEFRPDYILVLPWNLRDEIVQQMRHVAAWGCRLVVPVPELAVIDPGEL